MPGTLVLHNLGRDGKEPCSEERRKEREDREKKIIGTKERKLSEWRKIKK